MNKKMKIVSLLCAAVMLAGCSGNTAEIGSESNIPSETPAIAAENTSAKTAEDKSETTSDTADDTELYIPKNKLGEGIIDNILSEYISDNTDTTIMSDENAAKLEEAFRNIRINNSRFALPMMIMALPKGFSVKIDYDSKSEKITEDFCIYTGELYMDDEMCAYVTVMMREDSEEKYGIIFGITAAMSSMCKWSFGDIKYSNDTEKLIECFGEPSVIMNLSSSLSSVAYVTKNGSMIMFYNDINGITCMSLDTDSTVENMFLTEYVPYDDFDGIPEIPELTGETREIDWSMIFDEDCITIGNEKYPTLTHVGDFGEDITLFDYGLGNEYSANENYLTDTYLLMYKEREIGMLTALRKKEQQPEEAVTMSWMFTDYPDFKFPAAVMGIPFSQNFDDITNIYLPTKKSDSINSYFGVTEKDEEKYSCFFSLANSFVLLNVQSNSVNPEGYESTLEKLNEQ
ncbi:MAG: hypothetical protein K2K34_05340 [Oscillospiraceae bacterium]|nr:hypothetical protein [Oscillospiraceae bacterium]